MRNDYAGVKMNDEFQYLDGPDGTLPAIAKTTLILAVTTGESAFEAKDVTYNLLHEGKDFYRVADETPAGSFTVEDGEVSGIADTAVSEALNQAITDGVSSFEVGDTSYYFTLDGQMDLYILCQ